MVLPSFNIIFFFFVAIDQIPIIWNNPLASIFVPPCPPLRWLQNHRWHRRLATNMAGFSCGNHLFLHRKLMQHVTRSAYIALDPIKKRKDPTSSKNIICFDWKQWRKQWKTHSHHCFLSHFQKTFQCMVYNNSIKKTQTNTKTQPKSMVRCPSESLAPFKSLGSKKVPRILGTCVTTWSASPKSDVPMDADFAEQQCQSPQHPVASESPSLQRFVRPMVKMDATPVDLDVFGKFGSLEGEASMVLCLNSLQPFGCIWEYLRDKWHKYMETWWDVVLCALTSFNPLDRRGASCLFQLVVGFNPVDTDWKTGQFGKQCQLSNVMIGWKKHQANPHSGGGYTVYILINII